MARATTANWRYLSGGDRRAWIAAALALLCSSTQAADPGETPSSAPQAIRQPAAASVSADSKLDAQLILALKQSRGEPPFDKSTSGEPQPQPDIPIKDASGVLVDVHGAISEELLRHLTSIGGRLAPSPDPANVARAMIPLGALEALARRPDITSIAPARLERISRIEHDPRAPGGFAQPKP